MNSSLKTNIQSWNQITFEFIILADILVKSFENVWKVSPYFFVSLLPLRGVLILQPTVYAAKLDYHVVASNSQGTWLHEAINT